MSFLGVSDRSKGRSRSRSRSRSEANTAPAAAYPIVDPSLYDTRQPSHSSKSDKHHKSKTPGGFDDDDEDDDSDEDKKEIVMDWNDLPPHERPGYVPPGYPSAQKPYAQAKHDEVKYAPPLEPNFTDYRRTTEAGKPPSGPRRTYSETSSGYEQYGRHAQLPQNVKYSASPPSSPPRHGSYTATAKPVNGHNAPSMPPGYAPYQTGGMPYPAGGMPQMPSAGQYGSIEEIVPGGSSRHGSHAMPPPPPPQNGYGLTRHMSMNDEGHHHRPDPHRQASLSTGMGMLSVNAGNHAPSMYPGMAPPASPLLEAYKGAYQSMPSPLLMPHFDDDHLDDLPTLEPRHSNGHKKERRDSRDSDSPPRRSKAKPKARFEDDDIDDLPTLGPRSKKDRRDSRGSESPPSKSKRKPRFADDHDDIPVLKPRGAKDQHDSDDSSDDSEEDRRDRRRGHNDSREIEAVVPDAKSKHRRSKSYTHSNSKPARSPSKKGRVVMYDAEKDAKTIGAALNRSSHIDKQPLIDVLPTLSHDQLMELRAAYKKVAKVQGRGINIAKHIKLKTSGSFGKLMYVLALGRWESEGYWANYWYQSHSAKRELLIEALMGRTNQEIKLIKSDFQDKRYDDSLTKCMEKELKADKFRTAVLLALEERRQEEHDVWPQEYVNRDVDTLYDALRRKEGGETAILQVVVTRSDPHLRRVLQTYQRKYDSNFAKEALKKSNNLVGEVIAHILNGVINQAARDAMLLQHAITDLASDGKGQDRTELLISRLVRMHWEKKEFHQIKEEYRNKFRKNLEDDVEKYVRSDDTREACLGLCEV